MYSFASPASTHFTTHTNTTRPTSSQMSNPSGGTPGMGSNPSGGTPGMGNNPISRCRPLPLLSFLLQLECTSTRLHSNFIVNTIDLAGKYLLSTHL